MIEVNIDSAYSTQTHIEKCIEAFNSMKDGENQLQITFNQQIQEIDLLLIAYLTLFKTINSQIEIIIRLNGNIGQNNAITFKLYQYLMYSYLMTGMSCMKIFPNRRIKEGFTIDKDSPPNIFHQYFVLSESFMPIILVGKLTNSDDTDFYNVIFKDKIEGLGELPDNDMFDKNYKILYNKLNKWIKGFYDKEKEVYIPGIVNPSERIECIRLLTRLAFYNALKQTKIISHYFAPILLREHIAISKIPLTKNEEGILLHMDFYNRIKWVIEELVISPPIYHFIYSQLVSTELLQGEFNKSNSVLVAEKIQSLWHYSKEVVAGINELAKNVREHSNPPIGAITGRIYNERKWAELKKDEIERDSYLEIYINQLRETEEYKRDITFLDLNIIDLGNKGIIETLKEKTTELYSKIEIYEEYKNLLIDDIDSLSSNKIKFKHFLDPSLGNTLNQQSKKAIAHLGLLIFSNLVRSNSGLLRAGSINCEPFINITGAHKVLRDPIPFGTNYHVVLPISEKAKIRTFLPQIHDNTLESTPLEIKGIEELFNYEIKTLELDDLKILDPKSDKVFIFYIRIDSSDSTKLFTKIKQVENVNLANDDVTINRQIKNSIICLDFDNSGMDESDLFRFLGLWNLHFAGKKLILINLHNNIYERLILINEYFLDKFKNISSNITDSDSSIYWNEKSPILLFSFSEPRKNERFYFTNILWGKTKDDFYYSNKLISKTNFNATTLFLNHEHYSNYYEGRLKLLPQSGLFYAKTTLLPFDLILPGTGSLTIFENNVSVLLQNELIFSKDK